jgi:hypothetical protein
MKDLTQALSRTTATAFAIAASMAISAGAKADLYDFQDVTFADGGVLNGYFTYTPDQLPSPGFASGPVVNTFNIAVSGGNSGFPNKVFSNTGGSQLEIFPVSGSGAYQFDFFDPNDSFTNQAGGLQVHELRVALNGEAVAANQATPILLGINSVECYDCSPDRLIVSGSVVPTNSVTVQGGTQSKPAKLQISGDISEIESTIPGGQSSNFYGFHWNGGTFSASASVTFPSSLSNESSYSIVLLGPNGLNIPLLTSVGGAFGNQIGLIAGGNLLDSQDNYSTGFFAGVSLDGANLDACNPSAGCKLSLPAGDYEIGVIGDTSIDPTLTIGFDSPVFASASGAVPEPSTWAMILIGFAGLGYVGYHQARRASFQS